MVQHQGKPTHADCLKISCDFCHKPLDSEEFYEYQGKNYHFECMN